MTQGATYSLLTKLTAACSHCRAADGGAPVAQVTALEQAAPPPQTGAASVRAAAAGALPASPFLGSPRARGPGPAAAKERRGPQPTGLHSTLPFRAAGRLLPLGRRLAPGAARHRALSIAFVCGRRPPGREHGALPRPNSPGISSSQHLPRTVPRPDMLPRRPAALPHVGVHAPPPRGLYSAAWACRRAAGGPLRPGWEVCVCVCHETVPGISPAATGSRPSRAERAARSASFCPGALHAFVNGDYGEGVPPDGESHPCGGIFPGPAPAPTQARPWCGLRGSVRGRARWRGRGSAATPKGPAPA